MAFRAILFDLGNTLLEYSLQGQWREFRDRRVREMYQVVCDLRPKQVLEEAPFYEVMNKVITQGELRQREVSCHFRERLCTGLAEVGIEASGDMLEQLTDFFYAPVHDCTNQYPETAEVLRKIQAAGMKLAIINNAPWDTPARLLQGDLAQWGLLEYFDAFICSGDIPWRKPNPEFMWYAAKELCLPAAACLVVGDTLDADIEGAQAAGMKSVWINRTEMALDEHGPQPDWMVKSLAEVVDIIRVTAGG
jgi:FMN phosphatase YigB (HAD superfamily)